MLFCGFTPTFTVHVPVSVFRMNNQDNDLSFEEALIQLERVVAQLEKPDLPLKESVKHFEQGLRLSRYCSQILEQAELRVEHVKQNDTPTL